MPHEDMEEDPLSASQASPVAATAADAAVSTALASLLRTSCTIIDMGSYVLSECRNRAYTADDAALPCIAGEHVRQILPEALVERAALFPPFEPALQVAPSFFDAPGAQDTSSATAGVGSAGLLQPAPPSMVSLASAQRLSDALPNITFAFASQVGYKEVSRIDKQQALIALGRFKSCVRTSLLLCGGYECQEKEGTFMIAFPEPKTALEWALTLQLALLRLPWGEGLLGLAPTQEERSPVTGQLLFRGLSARILVEKSLIESVGLEWAGAEGPAGSGPAPAAASSHIATRNFALLTQRLESDLAASRSSYSFSSTIQTGRSGKDGSSFKRTTSVLPKVSFGNPRGSMDMQLPAVFISDDKGYLSPVVPGRNPRRSVDTPSHFKPMFSPTPNSREAEEGGVRGGDMQLASRNPSSSLGKEEAAKITKQRVAQEKKTLGRPSGSSDLLTIAVPSKSLDFAGMKKSMLYLNPTFGDTGGRGQEKISVPRLETAGKEASSGPSDVHKSHLGACGTLPSLPVKVEVYHMGQYSYKGINVPTDVCQILPASLSERRARQQESPVITNGKVTCLKKDDSFHFTAQVPLPSIFHLPLAAEPPLYINIVRSEFQSFSAMSHSANPTVTRA
ncbi:MAG: hypothetical protein FRX49_01201 [Trebouxia sp. A1-2]|nr:MAG: hypothetical protein FRX49_01201 [Trebouxia sp. A1-2]